MYVVYMHVTKTGIRSRSDNSNHNYPFKFNAKEAACSYELGNKAELLLQNIILCNYIKQYYFYISQFTITAKATNTPHIPSQPMVSFMCHDHLP